MIPLFSEISEIAGVTEKTIKDAYQDMIPKIVDLFPTDFQFVTPIEDLLFL